MTFSDAEQERYGRHLILDGVGEAGQAKLKAARVLVIGAGGLGSPLILYLAAAGVGTIGIVDDDAVDLSNLQRQVLHRTDDVGISKVESAIAAARALNPEITLVPHAERLSPSNARALFSGYDIVADGSDNFETRFLVNDACYLEGKTLVSAAVLKFDGQIGTFKAHESGPCYRCFNPEPPYAWQEPTCADAGILGAVAGVMGTLQATEVLKEIIGVGDSLSGRLMIYDALAGQTRTVKLKKETGCPLCGDSPSITDVS